MNKKILFLFLWCLLFSCREQTGKESSVTLISIPDMKKNHWMNMHDIVDTVVYVPLVTADTCLLDVNMLRRLEYYKGKFYCFVFTQGLYIFNSDGDFYKKIPFGRGPGELYMQNSHKAFWIDKTNNQLIFPGWYKLHFYDLDGNFILTQNLKTELVPAQVAVENGQYWFYFFGNALFNKKGDAFHFYQYNLQEGIKEGHLSANPLNKYGEGGFGTGNTTGLLAYSPLTSDTIFRIKEGLFSPAYCIDFGKNRFPSNLSATFRYDVRKRKSDYTGIIDDVVTNDTVLYFTFSRNRIRQEVYYFNHSKEVFTGSRHKKDDIYIPFGATMTYVDGYFIAVADAYGFTQSAPEIAAELELKEDDNPVVVLYKLKL